MLPKDIKDLVVPTLGHRLKLKPESELRGKTAEGVLVVVMGTTPLDLKG